MRRALLALPLVACGGGSAQPDAAPAQPDARPAVTSITIPYPGTFLGNAVGDFLGDGSTVVIFSGPSFENNDVPTRAFPFTAVRIDTAGEPSDVTGTLIDGTPGAQHARRALAVDLNGDGRLDFFCASHGWDRDPFPGERQTLLLSQPDGRLRDVSASLPPLNNFDHSATAADFRKVGRRDILIGQLGLTQNPGMAAMYQGDNTGGDYLGPWMLRNDGGGAFHYDNTSLPKQVAFPGFPFTDLPGAFTASLALDLDHDGAPDLVLGSLEQGAYAGGVLMNDGKGSFAGAAVKPLPVGLFGAKNTIVVDIVALDVSGDGEPDLVLSETEAMPEFYDRRRLQILVGDGKGGFADETATRLPDQGDGKGWAQFIFPVDYDGDGAKDLFLQADHPDAADHLVYRNDGSGRFSPMPASALPPASAWHSLTPIDFDHDGRVNLVGFEPLGQGRLKVRTFRR